MEEKREQSGGSPWQGYEYSPYTPPEHTPFPTGKRELLFAGGLLLSAMALCNFTLFGGFNLGFAVAAAACILCTGGYLLASGCKPTAYSMSLLGLSLVIAAGFGRSADSFVKFVMVCFLLVSINLGFCLLAGKNRRAPGGVSSLLDAPEALLRLGIGKLPEAFLGLKKAFERSGTIGQKGGAFVLGICIAVPILAVVIPLLVSADAAFDGLLQLLPEFDLEEAFGTVFFGILTACLLYIRGTALRHADAGEKAGQKAKKSLNPITVNTVLCCVCIVYAVYLLSQLAYFAGGFAGILPEEYTMAQYARRGFFEMAWLCAINLGVIALALALVRREAAAPLSTRLLCLFIGLVTLFLVATASAKMFLYIGTYGLTRLRILTQIIMLFLALTTALVLVWLFVPKLPYMKTVMLAGLVIGACVLWADVDTQVANYNVNAYLSGRTETVDVSYLGSLSSGAVPAVARLAEEAPEEWVAAAAQTVLQTRWYGESGDIRGWNYVNHMAAPYLPEGVDNTSPLAEDMTFE